MILANMPDAPRPGTGSVIDNMAMAIGYKSGLDMGSDETTLPDQHSESSGLLNKPTTVSRSMYVSS